MRQNRAPPMSARRRAELVAKQIKDAEDRVGIAGSVSHYLGRCEFGLLLEHDGKQIEAVTQGARHCHRIEPGELVRGEIVPGHAPLLTKIMRVRTRMDRSHGHGKSKPVGGGDLATAPRMGQRDSVFWAATSIVLAAVRVSARRKFCLTQLSRDRRSDCRV